METASEGQTLCLQRPQLYANLPVQIGARRFYDAHSIWVLSGTAVRIAHRLGIHREVTTTQMPPFFAEMRRRTWWQIVFLDGHASKLAGASFPAWVTNYDTKVPRNVSDSELYPSMKELPADKVGATEMLFCCVRYEVVQKLRESGTFTMLGVPGPSNPLLIAEKDKAIDALEKSFHEKYGQFCDPSVPFHLLVLYVAKSVICTMRIMSHHPRQYPDNGASLPQHEKDMLFKESLTEIEIDSIGHDHKSLQRFAWFTHMFFQLDAFIYVISELRVRVQGELADKAWNQVEISYNLRPELISDKKSLYFAIGNLTLKAWAKREEALTNCQVPPPRFISLLRSQRNLQDTSRQSTNLQLQNPTYGLGPLNDYRSSHSQDISDLNFVESWDNINKSEAVYPQIPLAEIAPSEWAYWQSLMDGDLPPYSIQPDEHGWS